MGLLRLWDVDAGANKLQSVLSCNGPGDYVDDMPAQSRKWVGCPDKWTNSCKEKHPGVLDDVANFMGYADDKW